MIELYHVAASGDVMLEPCLASFTNVRVHTETGERNSQNWPVGAHGSDQIDSAPIRQSEIANEHIELLLRYQIDRRLQVTRRLHMMAAQPKQFGKRSVGVLVVLDEQNAHGPVSRRPG